MNRKQRRITQSQDKQKAVIQLQGKSYTTQEAGLLALKEHSLGHFQAVVDIYRLILAKAPEHVEAWNNQGVVLQQMGRYEEALSCCDKAIALKADYAAAYYNRGNSLQSLERLAEAMVSYDKAVALKPDYAEAYNNRGITLQKMTRYEEALASYDKAIAIKPANAEAYNNRSVALQKMERYEEALVSCDKAIAIKPDHADAHNNRGVTLQKMKRYEESLVCCDKTIALKPNFAEAHNNRGVTLQEMNQYEEALASYDKAIVLKPNYAEAWYNRGITLQKMKLYDEALASYTRAIALKPDHAEAYNNRGVVLVNKGDMQEAEAMFQRALELKPDYPNPLFSLTNIHKSADADQTRITTIQAILSAPGISLRDREYLYFALGKIHDDCGRYDEAFDYYRQGNQLINADVAYDAEAVAAMTCNITQVFSKDFLAQSFSFASDSRSPVFIVGMPRSGTTLMASILSNHPSIGTAGELSTLTEFTLRWPELLPYPQSVKHLTPAVAVRLINDYEKRLRRDIGADVPYVIDKHPLNFRHLGLIAMLFPQAHIIHCTRHPLDTGLSNYFQRFALDYDYSFDLRNIGDFYGEYTKIMEHWSKILPIKMIDVSYEDMIMNTESLARRTLDFLGLEWDAHCLTPHTNPYAVETASNWQVRQPIYTQSVERRRHYEKHLAPLREALEAMADIELE